MSITISGKLKNAFNLAEEKGDLEKMERVSYT